MDTLKKQLSMVIPKRKSTIGRLDADGLTTKGMQDNVYHPAVRPLESTQVAWKQRQSEGFPHWEGLYAMERIQRFTVSNPDDSLFGETHSRNAGVTMKGHYRHSTLQGPPFPTRYSLVYPMTFAASWSVSCGSVRVE